MLVGGRPATCAVKLRPLPRHPDGGDRPRRQTARPVWRIDNGRVYATSAVCPETAARIMEAGHAPLAATDASTRWRPRPREGGQLGAVGPGVGPHGNLWVSSERVPSGIGDPYDGSDSVTDLRPGPASARLLRPMAPGRIPDDHDLDLGSTAPVLTAAARCFIMGSARRRYLAERL